MSRVYLTEPEPRPGRVPRGGAITPAGALRAWMDRRAAGEPADDAEPVTVPDDATLEAADDEAAHRPLKRVRLAAGHQPRPTLYGVSAEELDRMRAAQVDAERDKADRLRIRGTWPPEDRG